MAVTSDTVKAWLLGLQERIVGALEAVDGQAFLREEWQRPEGGGGISRLIEEGNVLERGGVNFSHVKGASLPPSSTTFWAWTAVMADSGTSKSPAAST